MMAPWTSDRVWTRIVEAARTMRVAGTGARGPGSNMSWWPGVTHNAAEAYGYNQARAPLAAARAAEITRMDETLGWLSSHLSTTACVQARLAPDSSFIVWGRAIGWSYRKLAEARGGRFGNVTRGGGPSLSVPGGNSEKSLRLIEQRALVHLANVLNRIGVPVDRETMDVPAPIARERKPRPAPPQKGGIRTVEFVTTSEEESEG